MSTTEGADIERYLKESAKSYKECSVKNTARRNSLQKKTLGIESERRLASSKMTREERVLKEQLRQMSIEKAKNLLVHNLRADTQEHDHHRKTGREEKKHHERPIPVEPYPITFRESPCSPELDRRHQDSDAQEHDHHRKTSREEKKHHELPIPLKPYPITFRETPSSPVYDRRHHESETMYPLNYPQMIGDPEAIHFTQRPSPAVD